MSKRPVVTNNTPLVALSAIGQLHLLRELFGEVLIPNAVRSEFLARDRFLRQAMLDVSPWLRVETLRSPARVLDFNGLDRGEAETLALAEERQARLILMDEKLGRRRAKTLNLPHSGTLGVLLLAKKQEKIEALKPHVEALMSQGLHLHDRLVDKVLHMADEIVD